MMREYTVGWNIALQAESAKDAAERALKIMRDRESIALVFVVKDEEQQKSQLVDLWNPERDECSHGVRRDLCPDCSPEDAPKPLTIVTWNDYEEQSSERYQGEPHIHSHNAGCYMLGQRPVSYRTCAKLEGEPE